MHRVAIALTGAYLWVPTSGGQPSGGYNFGHRPVADFDHAAAMSYATVRSPLEAAGTPIGPLDAQIAAHALALGVTLVSNNTREFERVPGLKLANWASPCAAG